MCIVIDRVFLPDHGVKPVIPVEYLHANFLGGRGMLLQLFIFGMAILP